MAINDTIKNQRRIALIAVPRLTQYIPPAGIAALKGALNTHNIYSKCFDLNINLYNTLSKPDIEQLDQYFQEDTRYISSSATTLLTDDTMYNYTNFLNVFAAEILSENFDYIGISIHSINSTKATRDLCKAIKRISDIKIIIGGAGVSSSGILGDADFAMSLKNEGFIDHYIQGEGEEALVNFIENTPYPGIDGVFPIQIKNLNNIGYPDYNDFDFSKYDNDGKAVNITGSRGCIRNCTFCDIKSMWNKYVYRSATNIVDEIEHHVKNGITEFSFTDSLINGSLKSFMEMCRLIIDRRLKISWDGQFIIRPQHQIPNDMFSVMRDAGASVVMLGVESGSNKILKDMGKNITREDILYNVKGLSDNNINCHLLMLSGFPTETKDDVKNTINMLHELHRYVLDGTISGLNLGKTMAILPGSPVGQNKEYWGIELDERGAWYTNSNNLEDRIQHWHDIFTASIELGYPVKWPVTQLNTIYELSKTL